MSPSHHWHGPALEQGRRARLLEDKKEKGKMKREINREKAE
jgi:hypothetical protein